MANSVDRQGTFRFDKVLEAGVGAKYDEKAKEVKNVSFNVRLHLSAFYDEQEGEWVDWSGYDVEVSAYLYLFGVNKKTKKFGPTFHHEAVMKVFNWDGKSFQILANDDYSKIKGQVRIIDNDPEYADKNPFQVANIDVFDADPSNLMRSLGAGDLKKLDTAMALLLQSSGKPAVAATVPAKKSTRPTPPAQKPPKATAAELAKANEEKPESPTPEDKQAILKAKSEKIKNARKADGPQPPKRTTTPSPAVSENSGGNNRMTKQQAWEFTVEMKNDNCDDEQLQASWNGAVNQIAGDKTPDEDVTEEQWSVIANQVIDEVGKF